MKTIIIKTPEEASKQIINNTKGEIILAAPLGAGKANHVMNALYRDVKAINKYKLQILTALTLQVPTPSSDLERRFLAPFFKRVFADYPNLEYEKDRLAQAVPENIKIIEFYFPPGKYKNYPKEQQNYLSSNYTHVTRDVMNLGVNVVCQQVCKKVLDNGETIYSLSCNPDTVLDLVDKMKAAGKPLLIVGQVNQNLPFMYGESIVTEDFFDILLDNRELDHQVFGPPKMSVSEADYMIGLHASTLVKDDGEIQIGIGSLGDSLVYNLCLRNKDNQKYRDILNQFEIDKKIFPVIEDSGSLEPFNKGLFAATEMFVDSFAMLFEEKILKKKVYDDITLQKLINQNKITHNFSDDILKLLYQERKIHSRLTEQDLQWLKEFGILREEVKLKDKTTLLLPDGQAINNDLFDEEAHSFLQNKGLGEKLRNGAVAHAGFFLGPQSFYQFLKDLPIEQRKLIRMKRISQINQLYGHEEIDRLQRKNGRFINTCMKVSLNGSASSDALEDNTQISGVGGQYNFVAMAHELPDARSILQLRSTRINKGSLESNIVFNYGNCTIPRHLRDIVITEYGIADLRGKTDQDVAIELIKIADSRFQPLLLEHAKNHGKIAQNYLLPERFKTNFPERYLLLMKKLKQEELFPPFPMGCDFTDEEIQLGKALKKLKKLSSNKISLISFLLKNLYKKPQGKEKLLKRMELDRPSGLKQTIYQKLILGCLDT